MNETRHYKDTEVVFSAYDTALNTCPLETVGWSAMSTYNSAKSSAWIILDCWFAASLTFPSEYHISDVVAYGEVVLIIMFGARWEMLRGELVVPLTSLNQKEVRDPL